MCLGEGELLGLVSRDLVVMRLAMKMLWAVTMGGVCWVHLPCDGNFV